MSSLVATVTLVPDTAAVPDTGMFDIAVLCNGVFDIAVLDTAVAFVYVETDGIVLVIVF